MKKIFKQAAKEYSFPLILSLVWLLYNIYGLHSGKWQIEIVISKFGSAFFILSWFTGQFFRIKKQTKTEDSFLEVEARLKELLGTIEDKTEIMIGSVTGGNSFTYLVFGSVDNVNNSGEFFAIHEGEFPLYDVYVRIVDLQTANNSSDNSNNGLAYHGTTYEIGNMIPKHSNSLGKWKLANEPNQSYNIFFTSRNGSFTQLLRLKKIDNEWISATKVESLENAELFTKIDERFPLMENGKVDWS